MSQTYHLIYEASGKAISCVTRLDNWWAKGRGVIGLTDLAPGQGLWFPGVASIHTCFVRFPLDVVFLDQDLRTVRCLERVRPWRLAVLAPGAHHTIEMGAGSLAAAGIAPQRGDCWEIRPLR